MNDRLRRLGLVLVLGCVAAMGAAWADNAAIVVSLDAPGRTIPAELFGSNIQWEHSGDRLLKRDASGAPGWNPGVLDAVADAGITVMRFPGGLLANTYRWQAGTGPVASRPQGTGFAGQALPSDFGTDEFIKFCRDAHVQGCVTVNVAAGAEEAAQWVQYLNGAASTTWGKKRSDNGYPEPLGVKYWEIGNEIYSPATPGYSTAAEYAAKVKTFATAMKAMDPAIKIGVALEASFQKAAWMQAVYPHLLTWNEQVLKGCGQDIDFVVLHYYGPFDKMDDETALRKLVWAGPVVFKQTVDGIRALLQAHSKASVEMVVNEYNTAFESAETLNPRIGSTVSSLFNAMLLFACMRDDRITMANHWLFTQNTPLGLTEISADGATLTHRPTFEVLKQLGAWAGSRVVPITITCPTYATVALGNVPQLSGIPVLDGIAALAADGTVRIAIVNRDPAAAVASTLNIRGGNEPVSLSTATLRPAGGTDIYTWDAPPKAQRLTSRQGDLMTFPAHSLTIITGKVAAQ